MKAINNKHIQKSLPTKRGQIKDHRNLIKLNKNTTLSKILITKNLTQCKKREALELKNTNRRVISWKTLSNTIKKKITQNQRELIRSTKEDIIMMSPLNSQNTTREEEGTSRDILSNQRMCQRKLDVNINLGKITEGMRITNAEPPQSTLSMRGQQDNNTHQGNRGSTEAAIMRTGIIIVKRRESKKRRVRPR